MTNGCSPDERSNASGAGVNAMPEVTKAVWLANGGAVVAIEERGYLYWRAVEPEGTVSVAHAAMLAGVSTIAAYQWVERGRVTSELDDGVRVIPLRELRRVMRDRAARG